MTDKLDFSLPQKKSQTSVAGVLTVLLLVVLAALAGVNLAITLSGRQPASPATATGFSAEQTRALAAKLAQRSLYEQAASAWQDYLATANLDDTERAKIFFQVGTLLEKAGLYGQAIEHYYRSETTAQLDELGSEINSHVKQCFEKLGKFAALRYELMDRTSLRPSEAAGGKIVAEIGPEKITEARLDALVEEKIENQLAPMEAFLTPEQLNEQKKRLMEQSRSPQAKQEFLQSYLAQEILYRQALKEELSEKPRVKQLVDEVTRQVLSGQLMNERLASRINTTETDVQMYYAAHKDKYIEPAKAKISHIRVSEQEKANEVLASIKAGQDFAELAKELSEDEATKANGGKIEGDVVAGSYVPGIGDANEINEAIFAAEAPSVLDQPFQTENGWEIVRVEEKSSERQKSFEEVRQQVMMELLRRKQEDVQRAYIDEMMNEYDVVIHTSAFAPAEPNQPIEAPTTK